MAITYGQYASALPIYTPELARSPSHVAIRVFSIALHLFGNRKLKELLEGNWHVGQNMIVPC